MSIADLPNAGFSGIHCLTLAQLTQSAPWQLSLTHTRPYAFLIWVTRGQSVATLRGVRRGVGPHNLIYLPPGTQFSFHPGVQCQAQIVISGVDETVQLPQESWHLRVRDGAAQVECTGLFEAIQRELSMQKPLSGQALSAHLSLLNIWLRRQLSECTQTDMGVQGRETPAQRLVQAFSDRIEGNFRTGSQMSEYAHELGITPTHLTRICRQLSGRTAAELISERLIWEARYLLSQPRPPIQEIARTLGFGSPAYFSRFMNKHTGQTPTALRKESREFKSRR